MNDLCPWCELPIAPDETPAPTRIETRSLGAVLLVHPICGAELLHAGMKRKPKVRRGRRTHSVHVGTAATVCQPPSGGPRLTVVRSPS